MHAFRTLVARIRFGGEARMEFYLDLSDQIRPGVPTAVSLARLGSRMTRDPELAGSPAACLVGIVFAKVRDGGTLAGALKGWVPAEEIAIVSEWEGLGSVGQGIQAARMHELARRRDTRGAEGVRTLVGLAGAAALIAFLLTAALDWRGVQGSSPAPTSVVEADGR